MWDGARTACKAAAQKGADTHTPTISTWLRYAVWPLLDAAQLSYDSTIAPNATNHRGAAPGLQAALVLFLRDLLGLLDVHGLRSNT